MLKDSIKIAFLILEELKARGMSQAELAKNMDVSPQYLGKILKGGENLTLETIWKIKSVLKIDLIEVCDLKPLVAKI